MSEVKIMSWFIVWKKSTWPNSDPAMHTNSKISPPVTDFIQLTHIYRRQTGGPERKREEPKRGSSFFIK